MPIDLRGLRSVEAQERTKKKGNKRKIGQMYKLVKSGSLQNIKYY